MSDTSGPTVAVVVNKDGGVLGPSETFLRAHIERLPHRTFAVLGNPGTRRWHPDGRYLNSRSLVARGSRWLLDRTGVRSQSAHDRSSLTRALRTQKADVVLAEYGPTALSVLPVCTNAGIPLVAHFHGWDAYVLTAEESARAQYRALWAEATAIIAVSRHMQQHLVSLGAPADRVIWNPCGAEPDPTPADPASAQPTFVSIGRPTSKKATTVILLAFAAVRSRIPTVRLDLVGADADVMTAQLVRALGIESSVTFHGPRPHEYILRLLRGARCYLHPSVTAPDGDREGTPVSVLEAMAAGLPVVSTLHGGIPDVLAAGGGTLVPEFDVAATAEAMIRYAADARLAATVGAEGRRQLESRWAMHHSLARLGEVVSAASRRDSTRIAQLALNGASE